MGQAGGAGEPGYEEAAPAGVADAAAAAWGNRDGVDDDGAARD